MIGVIVPAHDEALAIGNCLASIAVAAGDPRLEGEEVVVVVALDACSDATASVCKEYGVATVVLEARCVGSARAAAATFALASGARWIASTDADTVVPADWLWRQVSSDADVFCGVVGVMDWLDYPDAVRNAFSDREVARDGHRHIHGANLGMSAAAYLAVGGFQPLHTGEDVALVDAMTANGARVAWLARPAVATSARRAARAEHGFSGFLRALEREVMGAALLPVRLAPE
ncbi:glycosyltransferase [uncultured Stenotrophomonas sp.]|uniref:glycosyltransferase n=1 Tax=uncultured Stenotrophomonas sp. TaxID=165438 RepID=UPI0028E50726|nr:glycosyltransferase [uncultured Stenotrophomonas sp.]